VVTPIKKIWQLRVFLLFLLFFGIVLPALAASGPDLDQGSGKLFLYTVKRLGIPILKASLSIVNGSVAGDKSIYQIRVEIVTVNVSLLFRMNNRFTSTFDGNSGLPLQYVKEVDQGGLFIKNKCYFQTIIFDSLRNTVLLEKKGEKEKQEISVPKDTFDPLSMLARWYLKEGLPLNQEIRMTIFDGSKVRPIVFHARPERIHTEIMGEVDTVCVASTMAFLSFENKEGTIRIWYSRDGNRTPLRMELDIPAGKVQFELDEIREAKGKKIKAEARPPRNLSLVPVLSRL
jgi:hypothetical protein